MRLGWHKLRDFLGKPRLAWRRGEPTAASLLGPTRRLAETPNTKRCHRGLTTRNVNETAMSHHEDDLNLLPAYALGALDDADRRRITAHLDACPVCRMALTELAETTALLAFAPPSTRPDPRVKGILMARIAARGSRGNARVDPAPG